MARRRLEAALQAGKAIEKGISNDPNQLPEKITVKHTFEFEDFRTGVYSLQYAPDAESLVVGFGDGSIQVLSTKTGNLLKEIRKHKISGLPVTCIRFHPKDPQVFMATCTEGKINMFHATEGVHKDTIEEAGNEINCLDFSMEGDFYCTGGKDKHVRVYDVTTNKVMRSYEGYNINSATQNENSHAHRIFAMKFHPDHNNVFITGGWDNHLKCWDMRSKDPVKRFIHGPHICGDSVDIKGPYILTGSWVVKDALQVWDFGTGRLVQSVPVPHEGSNGSNGEFVYCAQFAEKTLAYAGGSGTNKVQVLNLQNEQVVGDVPLSHPVQAMDSIGRQFALAGACRQLKMAMIH